MEFTNLITTPQNWALFFMCATFIGMSKTGFQSIATISIPILVMLFGAKQSTGIVLPMLCIADLLAVIYYKQQVNWKYVFMLLPSAIIGFFLAIFVDKFVPEELFKYMIASCIFIGLFIMLLSKKIGEEKLKKIISSKICSTLFGLVGGFSTMIGNAAGPVMAVYLLGVNLPKFAFVGTSAWFFLTVNYLKVPLQIFAWNNINVNTILLGLTSVPFIIIGAIIGILFVKNVPEKGYKIFIFYSTILATLAMLF